MARYSREVTLDVQVLRWPQFQAMFLDAHQQGEHIAIVGPTGSGKTLVGLELCKLIGSRHAANGGPSPVAVLQTKPRDDTMRLILPKDEWPEIKRWPPKYGEEHCVVWVRGRTIPEAKARQVAVFGPLLDVIYKEGSQTVYLPEAAHFERKRPTGLGMEDRMVELWTTARSLKLTVISDTQRPRWVSVSMWTEPSWVIVFQPDYDEDLRHVAKLSGVPGVYEAARQLGQHEFLCVRRQRGREGMRALYVSRVEV